MAMRVRKGIVCAKCDSCGARVDLDNVHKIATYIIKNPPKTTGIKKEEDKKEGDEKKEKKDGKTTGPTLTKGSKSKKEEEEKSGNGKKEKKEKNGEKETAEMREVKLLEPADLPLNSE